jgi:hypothetical protein
VHIRSNARFRSEIGRDQTHVCGSVGPTFTGPLRAEVTEPQDGAPPDSSSLARKRDFSSRHNEPFNMSTWSRNPLQFLRFSDRVDRTEDGMPQACYLVEQFQSEWVVSVCGSRVLTCKTKRMALRAARRATVLLHRSQRAEFLGHEAASAGSDESFGRAGMVCRSS